MVVYFTVSGESFAAGGFRAAVSKMEIAAVAAAKIKEAVYPPEEIAPATNGDNREDRAKATMTQPKLSPADFVP